MNDDKQMYRAIYVFTEPKYASTPPSNIFLRATSLEQAQEHAKKVFEGVLVENGYSKETQFSCEVILSSQSEVEEYLKQKQSGKSSGMVN